MPEVRVLGNTEKLAEKVLNTIRRDVQERIREAFEAARRIVESVLEEEYRRLEGELRRLIKSGEERIKAYSAKREVEMRMKTSELLSDAVEEIVEEALSRIKSYIGEKAYEEFMARMLSDAVERLRGRGEIVVEPAEPDRELVSRLVESIKAKGISIRLGDTVSGRGGFLASAPEAGLTVDYRLEVILAPALDDARARVLEILRS